MFGRMGKVFATLVAVLVLVAGAAWLAMDFRDDEDAELVLQAPDDYCSVNAFYPSDGEILEAFQESLGTEAARVLAMYADCEELHAARTNGGGLAALRHYAVYMDLTDRAEAYRGRSRSEILPHLFEASKSVTSDNPDFYPALHLDKFAVYSGLLSQGEGRSASVAGLTVVRGRHISLTLVDLERNGPDLQSILDRQKVNMERLVAANE